MKTFFSNTVVVLLVILWTGCTKFSDLEFATGSFEIGINDKGQISKLIDLNSNVDYLIKDNDPMAVLAIKVGGDFEYPSSCVFNKENASITLNYPKNSVVAEIKIEEKDTYLTLELVDVSNKENVELILWGPFKTSIKETIGETIGIVRNINFAIGIQALNMRTLGGYPTNDDDSTPSFNIFGTTSLVDVPDSLNILYRGNTALPTKYGSTLQAYTRNRSEDRIVASMDHEKYLAPSFKDAGIVGSKIALFGCDPEEVLNTIEAIELKEGLPHPMLDGAWNKRVATATSAYLIQNFTSETIDEAIALTKKAGLKYLYHPGPFENWGQFDLTKKSFPDNWESMKVCVDKAEKEGVKVGLHTLSNFITTNDPYVTPIPDDRLAKVGSAILVKSIDKDQINIEISDPTYFNQMKNNSLHAVVIEQELIRYEAVSEKEPWVLLNCQRGVFGTNTAAHEKGVKIAKLIDHAYKTFLTNTELSVEMASTIADLYNKTGLKQISFDGLEGNFSTGMGAYGQLLFVDAWYSKLKPEIKDDYIMDASRSGHFFWHMFTRMNWGEPWYADFRESQTAYRILNQDYFRRNYIPSMLGWFSMRANTSIEDIEWMLARSAAFDAGYALVTSPELVGKNGFAAEILEKIKQWEKARISNAFTIDQKKRMEDINAEFTLQNISVNSWNLTPFSVQRFEHKFKIRQPGEPVWSSFSFKNEYDTQPLQFILKTTKGTAASDIIIEIDDFKKIELNVRILAGQYLKYSGGNNVILYDETWNKIQEIPINPATLTLGNGAHKFKVDCKFSANDEASLKLELKTAGIPENVILKK